MSNFTAGAIFFKGEWHSEDLRSLEFLNSAVFFGESTFTTMRIVDGEIVYGPDHLDRLERSLKYLFPDDYNEKNWNEAKEELSLAASEKREGYLRATFLRGTAGLEYFFYHRAFPEVIHENPEATLVRARGRAGTKLIPSFLKTSNYLETHLELKWAYEAKFSEVLFLDVNEIILECSHSNIFWVKDGVIYTPALQSGVLEGVMRKNIIKATPVVEGHYKVDVLRDATEVWICNALRGLTAVSKFEDVEYVSREIFAETKKILRDF